MLRNNKYLIVGGTVLASLAVGVGGTYFLTTQKANKEISTIKSQLEVVNQQLLSYNTMVYTPIEDIAFGSVITESNVIPINIRTDRPITEFLGPEDFGKVSLINLPAMVPITKSMVAEDKGVTELNLRNLETNCLWIPLSLQEGTYVDVRLVYPNGEDFVIISKTQVRKLVLESNLCYFWVSEDELLRLNGAIVDAALKPGAKIYVTEYVQPELQEASVVTYNPNEAVISLIVESPNVVNEAAKMLSKTARASLEERLAAFMEANPDVTIESVFGAKSQVAPTVDPNGTSNTEISIEDGTSSPSQDITINDVAPDNNVDVGAPSTEEPIDVGGTSEEPSNYEFDDSTENPPISIDGEAPNNNTIFLGGN